MAVSDEQMATFRAQLAGSLDVHKRLLSQLDKAAAATGYTALVSAAFCVAVERRFASNSDAADVIGFVAEARARVPEAASIIDPRTAERLIRAVYTDEEAGDISAEANFRTQLLLTAAMAADEHFDDERLDEFLGEARKLADQWLA